MISDLAVVETQTIGKNVAIGPFAVIAENVRLGDGVVIHPHVVIESGVEIGDGVEVFPGAYIGKEPKGAGALARLPVFERIIIIGAHTSIGPNAVIYYDVEIGENTLIGDGASIREQCRIGARCIISRYVTVNYNSTIGDGTKVMDLTHITGNCKIGSNVFISTLVGTTNDNAIGHLEYDEERVLGPTVGNDAAIGVGASLLPGTVVGEGAIVGAGALVTRDVEPYTLVMGIPAKYIRDLGKPR